MTRSIQMRLADGTLVEVPDPSHLDPWIEKDEPLATDSHHDEQIHCLAVLRALFPPPRAYVTIDRWLRMDPADPRDRLQPDLLVAFGVPHLSEGEYDPIAEGKPPDVLFEMLSPSSLAADLDEKPSRYARLGVREYFVINTGLQFAVPPVQGWRLFSDGRREFLPFAPDGVTSQVLGVHFTPRYGRLALLDPQTGAPISDAEAERLARHAAEERAADDRRARRAAEAEVARLRALLEQPREPLIT